MPRLARIVMPGEPHYITQHGKRNLPIPTTPSQKNGAAFNRDNRTGNAPDRQFCEFCVLFENPDGGLDIYRIRPRKDAYR